jgi:hypothetical protein
MNEPIAILELAHRRIGAAGWRGAIVTTMRRCVCVLAMVLLFLATGVGSMPSSETPILYNHGLKLQALGNPARADTLAGSDQERRDKYDSNDGVFSTQARFKAH